MLRQTQNIHVREIKTLIPPRIMKDELPSGEKAAQTVIEGRDEIERIIRRQDSRLLVIAGPCSIHDTRSALEYAERLSKLRVEFKERMAIIMRVYFEKPRTSLGWKGLINDPHMNGSYDIDTGLRIARRLLLDMAEIGIPAATEFLDPIIPQYTADLVTWAAIGARTTESQTHREMASGLSMPVGFKNSTDGRIQGAINAMKASMNPHNFLGIDQDGVTSIVRTTGNPVGHIVLRGGKNKPNYDESSIIATEEILQKAGLPGVLMVDCSHDNSGKQHLRQKDAWENVINQRINGRRSIIGLMLESFLREGNQNITDNLEDLEYGVSVTDSCLDWDSTETLLRTGYEKLGARP